MRYFQVFLWDGENDAHIAAHGVTTDEFEYVVQHVRTVAISHSSGRPIVFGETASGRQLTRIDKEIDEIMCDPITAYEIA